MLAASSSPQLPTGAGVLLGLVGGGLLMLVLLRLPLLQTAFAVENRFGAMFELRKNRQRFNRAPIACYFAILFTLALALPLYLLKIEVIPREAAWLPSLLFVMSIYPARLLTGWACGRAARREQPRHWFWRFVSRLGLLPVAAIYVIIVYFTQYLSWYGIWSLYEQHAFLLPVPFLGISDAPLEAMAGLQNWIRIHRARLQRATGHPKSASQATRLSSSRRHFARGACSAVSWRPA